MNINQLKAVIYSMEEKGLTEVCLEGGKDIVAQKVLLDSEGNIVFEGRLKSLQKDPYDIKVFQKMYEGDKKAQEQFSNFKDFYQHMESKRLKEQYLIANAKFVMMLS